MKFIKWTIYLIFTLSNVHDSAAQCGYEDWSFKRKPDIPNEPYFWFTNNVEFSYDSNGKIIIKVDTSYFTNGITYTEKLSNNNFGLYTTDSLFSDSTHQQNTFIKNLSSQISYQIGLGEEQYSVDLKNCFIYFFIPPKGRWKISVFDYKNSSVTFYDINALKPIGNNDTCIYIAPYNLKLGRRKFRYGTIISLNENGIKIVKPVLKRNSSFDHSCLFYSNTFTVHKSFLYKVQKDCDIVSYYSIRINYCNKPVDSLVVPLRSFSLPYIKVEGDTLICQSYDDAFRKYITTKSGGTWLYDDWVKSFPVLKYNLISYFNKGDLLFLKVNCKSEDKNGLALKDGNLFTLNEIPLKSTSTVYSLVLVFNIRNNKFLGYPKIIFTANK